VNGVEGFLALAARVAPLSPAAARDVAQIMTPRTFAAGSYLLKVGDRAEWCHYVVAGLVRELFVASDGTEHTRSFIPEGDVTGSLVDLVSDAPAITLIEALEPTTTLAWRYRGLEALALSHPDLQLLMRRWTEQIVIRKTRREHEMLALTAAVRYESWLETSRHLDSRVRRRDLASYLGITPEHLSRLRHRRPVGVTSRAGRS
jgi:CRP-like cAMP-binding protein